MIDLHGFGDQLLFGTLMTLRLALVALGVGLVLGLLGAAAKSSRLAVLRFVGEAYSTIFRGIPELLVVLLVYFGSSTVLMSLAGMVGYDEYIELNPFVAGVTALGMTFGAYASEVFRGALLTVPKGHVEAGMALGLGRWRIFRRIVLPQMWRVALPGLGNLFLVLLKDTALVSVIGLDELMRKAAIAVGATKEPFTFYLAAAAIYLTLTIVAMIGLHLLERSTMKGVRRVQA